MKRKAWTVSLLLLLSAICITLLARSRPSPRTEQEIVEGLLRAFGKTELVGGLEIVYPRTGTVFPPEVPAPTLDWEDSTGEADSWLVTVELDGEVAGSSPLLSRREWKLARGLWRELKQRSADREARISVVGVRRARPGRVLAGASTRIRISRDPVEAQVFYRDVPLPFRYAANNPATIRWRLGDLSFEGTQPVVLRDLPVCGNCHSFSRDGKTLGMDVDYGNDKGSYAIIDVEPTMRLSRRQMITWSDYRRDDGERTFGLLSQVSPDGRYVVSTVKDRSVFVPIDDDLAYSQLFFPIKGILVIYDRETKQFSALPGADDPDYVQSNPTWTPDGKHLLFARAPAFRVPELEGTQGVVLPTQFAADFIEGRREIRYDLYRVPFASGKGVTPQPVPGASNNGQSNFFPRISPDGKWMVFTQARRFMLLQPDSKLYLMPAEGGTPRLMTCNTESMNSWHSWSPNSRWLVFSSKARGPYTQLYLTHIDEEGRDTPPVWLENLGLHHRAANVPEFVRIPPGGMERIVEDFVDDSNLVRQGNLLQMLAEYEKSVEYCRMAIARNPDNLDARNSMGNSMVALEQCELAEPIFREVLARDPSNLEALKGLATLYRKVDRRQEMMATYEALLKLEPDNSATYENLGKIHLAQGEKEKAVEMYRKAVELSPELPEYRFHLADLLETMKRPEEALAQYRAAIERAPETPDARMAIVTTLMHKPELYKELRGLLERTVKEKPDFVDARVFLGELCLNHEDLDGASRAFEAARKMADTPAWLEAKLTELESRLTGKGSPPTPGP